MSSEEQGFQNARVKACNECRQQKLRCDALRTPDGTCSRCRRKSLDCVMSSDFKRTKRKTKAELQAELDALKKQRTDSNAGQPHAIQPTPPKVPALASPPESEQNSNPNHLTPESTLQPSMPHSFYEDNFTRHALDQTIPRALFESQVAAEAIDDCFECFFKYYHPQLPAADSSIRPNLCYSRSPFLFWTITAIGARKYAKDPTLLPSLVPGLNELMQSSAFSRDRTIYTIQALMLLITWPMPVDSLSKDVTPMLAGVLLQHSLSLGLHIFGVGQDFSRIELRQDLELVRSRARLWALCIVVCQRVSCADGVPPVSVPDNHDHEYLLSRTLHTLSPVLRFEKTLSRILTESILELERSALSKSLEERAKAMNSIIDAAMGSLTLLEPECPAELDRFYLFCAELQVLLFHLLIPKTAIEPKKLAKMFFIACNAIDIVVRLDELENFADHAPSAVLRYLTLACFTILKLSRTDFNTRFDLRRGRNAYFAGMHFLQKSSIELGDIHSRSASILKQLWMSKKIFRMPDGSCDALSIRCGSRLAMSVVYDSLWWWRSEFAGLPNPYEEKSQETRSSDSLNAPSGSLDNTEWTWQDSGSSSAAGGMLPQLAWPTTQDLIAMDWIFESEQQQPSFPSHYSLAATSPMPDLSKTWM